MPRRLRVEPLEDRAVPAAFWTTNLVANGSASFTGSQEALTTAYNQYGSVFTADAVDVTRFHNRFTFQILPGSTATLADGLTFTIERNSPTALGKGGGGLGYGGEYVGGAGGIPNSVAVKFDVYNNQGEGTNSTGLYQNGIAPTVPSVSLNGTGLDLKSGHVFLADMAYNGTTLSVTIEDTLTGRAAGQSYAIDIPAVVVGGTAYVGFTGSTGLYASTQSVQSWDYFAWNALPSPITWTGGGGTAAWSDPSNWDLDRAPADGDSLIFPGGVANTTSTNDLTGLAAFALDIRGDGYTLTGNPVDAGSIGSGGFGVTLGLDTTIAAGSMGTGGYGLFDVMGGSLNLDGIVAGGSIGSGGYGFNVASGATVALGGGTGSGGVGGIDLGSGSMATIRGTVDVESGAAITVGALDATGHVASFASIQNGGKLNVQGSVILAPGSTLLDDSGTVTVGPTGDMNVSGILRLAQFAQGEIGGTLKVSPTGQMDVDGLMRLVNLANGEIDGKMTVGPTGTMDIQGFMRLVEGSTGEIDGRLIVSPTGDAQIGGEFTVGPDGDCQVGGSVTFDSTADARIGGVFTVEPGGDAQVGGAVTVDPGADAEVGGQVEVQDGGTFNIPVDASLQTGMSGGSGAMSVSSGGTVNLGGTLDVAFGGTVQLDGVLDPPLSSTILIHDTSTFTVGSTGSLTVGHLLVSDSGTATVNGTLTVPAGGSVVVTGDAALNTSNALSVSIGGTILTWPTPAAIAAGTPLGAAQLNATANVPGTFTYTPAAGTVLPGGAQTLGVTFMPDDTAYPAVGGNVTVNVTVPTVQFAVANETLNVSSGNFALAVTLSAVPAAAVAVPFTLGGTAVPGTDYAGLTAGNLAIPANQTAGNLAGTVLNPGLYGGPFDRTLTVTLGTPGNAALGAIPVNTLTITAVTPRPAIPGLTAQQRYVQALYLDELGRAGAAADGWVGLLASPKGAAAAVAAGIKGSPEGTDHLVKTWYQMFLGRPAAGGEEAGWARQLQGGQAEEAVLSQILDAPEFHTHAVAIEPAGTASERLVRAYYQLLLHRTANAAEVAGWVNALPALGVSGVALGFLRSGEFRAGLFTAYYDQLLHRAPGTPEVAGWVGTLQDATRVRLGFETSAEFASNG